MNKALHGLLESALQWYKELRNALEADGFKINPYDPCVANKDINRKQMTLVWHVDDILASHVDKFEIILLVARLAKVFKCDPTVKRADVLDVLGIDMDFLQKEKVLVS